MVVCGWTCIICPPHLEVLVAGVLRKVGDADCVLVLAAVHAVASLAGRTAHRRRHIATALGASRRSRLLLLVLQWARVQGVAGEGLCTAHRHTGVCDTNLGRRCVILADLRQLVLVRALGRPVIACMAQRPCLEPSCSQLFSAALANQSLDPRPPPHAPLQ